MSALSAPYMHDEAKAFEHVEAMLWAQGPVCPKCGVVGNAGKLTGVRTKPSNKNPEGKERYGLWKCRDCKSQFTVRIGTIFEKSHIEMKFWLQAIYLMTSSKKGISSHQLARTLGLTVKSAWFMSHRIREAMRTDGSVDFGSGGGIVEVDETFIGKQYEKPKNARGGDHKNKMLTLVDRTTGRAKSIVVQDLKVATLLPILGENIAAEATVYTDEARQYSKLSADFADHDSTLTIAEVCRVRCDEGAGKPRCVMPTDGDKYLNDFFDNDFFWLVELSPALAVRARELYRAYPTIRIPNDSVHLATALSESVDELHTYDGNDLIELTGQTLRADGEPLKICVPEALSLDLFSNEPLND